MEVQRKRRLSFVMLIIIVAIGGIFLHENSWQTETAPVPREKTVEVIEGSALAALGEVEIKGRAPKTDYSRDHFGDGWALQDGCDTRNIILNRDLENVVVGDGCKIQRGVLTDPYTGKTIEFQRGSGTSDDVQIDHVVALSDAWQKGAQQLTPEKREAFANDPLELLAVDGTANQQKSNSDAASWLPANKAFRCQYVARQIAVKLKYDLWMTQAEYDTIRSILLRCPNQALPSA